MIERWNANRDKHNHEVLQVCQTFRQTMQNIDALVQFLFAASIVKEEAGLGRQSGKEPTEDDDARNLQRNLKVVAKVLKPNNKPVRQYRARGKEKIADMEAQAAAAANEKKRTSSNDGGKAADAAKKKQEDDDEDLDQFLQVRKEDDQQSWVIKKALAFSLKPFDSLLQKRTIRQPGNYRIRLAFSQKLLALWDRSHEVYVGILYGTGKFFGYLVGASPFLGVFEVRNVSGVCQRPEQSMFLTGSGNKVELDLDVTIGMPLVNSLHTVACQICANNSVIACDNVQWTAETMRNGVRLQIVPINLQVGDEIDCRMTWVSNGSTCVKGEDA
mmetsp:Transcript_13617/g.33498  ORF Transcript_13617/g.33498 Transcript_13617/m.33498 type:complete len:329 (-) Transcript_13617:566-1552(-)|eukprot:g12582.t1